MSTVRHRHVRTPAGRGTGQAQRVQNKWLRTECTEIGSQEARDMVQGILGQGNGAQQKCEAQSKRDQPEGQSSVQDTTGQTKKTNHGALAQGKVGTTGSTDR
jgi:hypothetical protein